MSAETGGGNVRRGNCPGEDVRAEYVQLQGEMSGSLIHFEVEGDEHEWSEEWLGPPQPTSAGAGSVVSSPSGSAAKPSRLLVLWRKLRNPF